MTGELKWGGVSKRDGGGIGDSEGGTWGSRRTELKIETCRKENRSQAEGKTLMGISLERAQVS